MSPLPRTAIILLLAALAPNAATAADPARAKAKDHFTNGEKYYAAKQYREAIDEYTAAYDLLAHPAFLFNIGQCHRALEKYEQAIAYFERYLREAENHDDRALVEQLIAESKAALGASAPPPPPAETKTVRPDISLEPGADETPSLTAEAAPLGPSLAVTTEPPADEPIHERWWFWPAIGVIAIAAAGTIAAVAAGGDAPRELPSGSAGTLDWR